MGIVVKQSIKNTIITYLGFGIGAINVLFLYTNFLSDDYFGLITFILSTANILMPLMAFGVHNTIVKFYSSFKTRQSQNSFLSLMLLLPLLIIIPFGLIGYMSYNLIGDWLSKENTIIKDYTWLIFVSAVCFAYFEIFYAWVKVQLKSVFGNFLKEVFHRIMITGLLFTVYYDSITVETFIYSVVGVYVVRLIIMNIYAFSIRPPVFKIIKLSNLKAILKYTSLIIIAGSIATIILEIDKFMIGQLIQIENVAYYGVAIYIATVIGVPSRSMHQITYPLTAKLLNENNKEDLVELYKKSSLNLFIVSGFIFTCIIININQLYHLIPEEYTGGVLVVLLIGIAKLCDNLLGNNNAILFNSNYYRVVLLFGILLAIITVVLNIIFIPMYGMEGAAIASFIAIFIYNAVKLLFVKFKFNMQPFSFNTFKVLLLITVSTVAFYFWEFAFHPLLNIALKSLLISLFFGTIVYKFNFSRDISMLIQKILRL